MARGLHDYYHLSRMEQYNVKLYYSILLVIGNDVMPSTQHEFVFCSFILFCGAFVNAYVIGGITAEMAKSQQKTDKINH